MKLINGVFIALFLCSSLYAQDDSPPSPQAQEHYCDDKAGWQQWDELLAKYPGDDKINSLYAFRVGLCSMVKSGQIETRRAVRLFERMRDVVLRSAEEENSSSKTSSNSRKDT